MMRTLILWLVLAAPAFAVQPDEVLDDPALETRARALSSELRCLVCRNESIDESDADLARDLRLLVRERLLAGDSDEEVINFIVVRYGEYVLLSPQKTGVNLILWFAGPMALLAGAGVAMAYARRRQDSTSAPLSEEEKSRLDQILND